MCFECAAHSITRCKFVCTFLCDFRLPLFWSFAFCIQFSRCPNDAFRPCHLLYYIKTFGRKVWQRKFNWIGSLSLHATGHTGSIRPTSFLFDSINGHLRRIEKLTSGMGKLQFVMFSLWILISYLYSCAHHSLVISIKFFGWPLCTADPTYICEPPIECIRGMFIRTTCVFIQHLDSDHERARIHTISMPLGSTHMLQIDRFIFRFSGLSAGASDTFDAKKF